MKNTIITNNNNHIISDYQSSKFTKMESIKNKNILSKKVSEERNINQRQFSNTNGFTKFDKKTMI